MRYLPAVFLAIALFFRPWPLEAAGAENPSRSLLILHSYHNGLKWTDEEDAGIRQTLKDNKALTVYTEYLDWKNFPDTNRTAAITSMIRQKYSGKKISVILATDDAALEYLEKNRAGLFGNVPVVFCGVNDSEWSRALSRSPGYTGVFEIKDVGGVIELANRLKPGLKTLFIIADSTESGQASLKQAAEWSNRYPAVQFDYSTGLTTRQILDRVRRLGPDSSVFFTTYYTGLEQDFYEIEDFARLLQSVSRVPVYNMNELALGHGVTGGSFYSGRMQGSLAAAMALRILKGEKPSSIKPLRTRTTRIAFDYHEIKRLKIPEILLPAGSTVINRPASFYEQYRQYVWAAVIVFILLSFIILLLLVNIYNHQRLNKALEFKVRDRTTELEKSNRQQTLALEELKTTQSVMVTMEKMASLGQLASLITHELNTPLGAIQSGALFIDNTMIRLFTMLAEHSAVQSSLDRKLTTVILSAVVVNTPGITENTDRKTARALQILLEERHYPRAEELAQLLADLGYNTLPPGWEEIEFSRADLQQWLAMILPLISCRRAALNIRESVRKAGGVVSALKDYQLDGDAHMSLLDPGLQIRTLFEQRFADNNWPFTLKTITDKNLVWGMPDKLAVVWQLIILAFRSADLSKAGLTVEILKNGDGVEIRFTNSRRAPLPIKSGLTSGLELAHGIVEKLGGRLEVEAEMGLCRVYLKAGG